MITFHVEGAQFNLRVAGIAVAHGCVLLHQMSGDAFWTLPGGRPEIMETGAAALRREMREETGLEVGVGHPICIAENFFTYRATAFHEILMCFEMITPSSAEVVNQRFEGTDRSSPLTFWWCPLDVLDDVALRPAFLLDVLRRPPSSLVHLVQDDRKAQGPQE
jgi:8-oxo-dGTP pyrophosphatase MutT (NUDIX family)